MPKKAKKNKRQIEAEEADDWDKSGDSDAAEMISSKDVLDRHKGKKKEKKSKNKKKGNAGKKIDFEALKQERQQALLELGKELMQSLDAKYASLLDDEVKEMWQATVEECADVYDDEEDWMRNVEDDALFKQQQDKLRDGWEQILAFIGEQGGGDDEGEDDEDEDEADGDGDVEQNDEEVDEDAAADEDQEQEEEEDEEEEKEKEVQVVKKKRKQKKQQQPQPQPSQEESEEEAPVQRQNKKGKKNKKKNKKAQRHSDEEDAGEEEEVDAHQHKNKNKKKKNKGKGGKSAQQSRDEQLSVLKEQRQQTLLRIGNDLMLNLDVKYAEYFDEEMQENWKEMITECISAYEEDNWQELVENDEFFAEKKAELKEQWNDIFALIEQDWEKDEEQRLEAEALKEREQKIADLAAQGIRVGGASAAATTTSSSSSKSRANKKRDERKKMAEIKARLAAMDKLAVEQEQKQKKAEEQRLQREKEERRQKEEQLKAQQAQQQTAAAKDDWSGDSSSESEDEKVRKKKNNKKTQPKTQPTTQTQKKGKGKKTNALDSSDDDDDEWNTAPASKKKQKSDVKVVSAKTMTDALADSDDDAQQQQHKKKGRRGRKKKPAANIAAPAQKEKEKEKPKAEQSEALKQQKEKPKIEEKRKDDSDDDDDEPAQAQNRGKGKGKGKKGKNKGKKGGGKAEAAAAASKEKSKAALRSPICVVMGHVDTGKTKILDHIRSSNVQNKEAGGITQQIGATYLSVQYIKERTARLQEQETSKLKYKIPGLLFIDTPGHESFSNLRSRGSSMCDIAVLVVDLMHGLEPQTLESLRMLQERKAPFVVALNKIDCCYQWNPDKNAPFKTTFANQGKKTKDDFETRLAKVKLEFNEQGLNAELYINNKRMDRDISLVPTSAITGEGIPDLLYLITFLTKKYMESRISFNATETKASVLEVKKTEGYGATIDVIVSNGTLRSDDTIVVCGMSGPIVTPIRALLLPQEAQEMRVKGEYKTAESVSASVGVRIAAIEDLSTAVAGAPLLIVPRALKNSKNAQKRHEVIEALGDEVQKSFADLFDKVDKTGRGVFVQSSTLGSLEALLGFLHDQKIPVSGIGIGTIAKKTIMKASVMLGSQPEYAIVLAFNVKCNPDARQLATDMGVRIFEAEIIYHLQEMFENYIKEIRDGRKSAAKDVAVFPVEFRILSEEHIFNNKNPLVLGVEIKRGTLRLNTPVVAQRWNANQVATPMFLGKVDGIKSEDKDVSTAKKGDKVSVRIMGEDTQKNLQVGRSFLWTDPLVSEISRESIDALKANFADEIKDNAETVQHLGLLKKYFGII